MEIRNVFKHLPSDLTQEVIEKIAGNQTVRIERIVSQGHVTQDGSWYDQQESEWVMLIQGTAEIQFEGEDESTLLQCGDHVFIPPRCRHRVTQTSTSPAAIWLAVFFQ